ncbi:uncharacterized protein EAF01_004607 [Botrytis porri]|uniref:uncharacterized protein n=1 Tax=Botrytis porri TaxID=87229 RepID=UPI001901F5C5|nr:uncharacterized protein EAF01_004607 [Botrytis porri]KAF7907020.1 hypothetical protein EAF01_004607 [Botrytis porri]
MSFNSSHFMRVFLAMIVWECGGAVTNTPRSSVSKYYTPNNQDDLDSNSFRTCVGWIVLDQTNKEKLVAWHVLDVVSYLQTVVQHGKLVVRNKVPQEIWLCKSQYLKM